MFGYLRFVLAILVILQHLNITIFKHHPGVVAVTCFYMLAGFVVTHLLGKTLQPGHAGVPTFYAERLLRIFPMYFFMLLLSTTFLLFTGYGNPAWNPTALLNNLLIIPLNYYMVWDSAILDSPHWCLLPPAWSLGLELQAYLLLPMIILYKRVKIVLAVLSLGVFFTANFAFIDTDYFGYRLLPGVFFIFILGSCLYKQNMKPDMADGFDKAFPKVCAALCILGVLGMYLDHGMHRLFAIEVLVGTLFSIVIISYFARSKRKLPLDKLLGDMSYGIFLSHFIGIWIANYIFPDLPVRSIGTFAIAFGFAVLASLAGVFLVENRFIRLRYKLTNSAPK